MDSNIYTRLGNLFLRRGGWEALEGSNIFWGRGDMFVNRLLTLSAPSNPHEACLLFTPVIYTYYLSDVYSCVLLEKTSVYSHGKAKCAALTRGVHWELNRGNNSLNGCSFHSCPRCQTL